MSAEKRPGSDAFGSTQMVVKRQRSVANLGNGSAIAIVDGNSANGALIQTVNILLCFYMAGKCGLNESQKSADGDLA